MNRDVISTWVSRLEAMTKGLDVPRDAATIEGFIADFSDDHGDRRTIDAPQLARLLDGDAKHFVPMSEDDAATALMKAVGRRDRNAVRRLIRAPDAITPLPLVTTEHLATLEAETERELAAVHALGRAVMDGTCVELESRLAGAVRWVMAELQPDNATHRPWGVHTFVWAAATMSGRDATDAELYAQTLVHNASVASSTTTGRIDRFSLVLLLDAQRALTRVI